MAAVLWLPTTEPPKLRRKCQELCRSSHNEFTFHAIGQRYDQFCYNTVDFTHTINTHISPMSVTCSQFAYEGDFFVKYQVGASWFLLKRSPKTETKMSSPWRNFLHCLHRNIQCSQSAGMQNTTDVMVTLNYINCCSFEISLVYCVHEYDNRYIGTYVQESWLLANKYWMENVENFHMLSTGSGAWQKHDGPLQK